MHDDKLKHIEDLYSGLSEAQDAPLNTDWNKIAPKVKRFNFFSVKYNTFNIFYAGLIALTTVFSSYLAYDNVSNRTTVGSARANEFVILYDTITKADTFRITDTLYYLNQSVKNEPDDNTLNTYADSVTKQQLDSLLETKEMHIVDSVLQQVEKDKKQIPEQQTKRIKKVTVIKKKKVIIKDTVRIPEADN